jgi:hypothetical protein
MHRLKEINKKVSAHSTKKSSENEILARFD